MELTVFQTHCGHCILYRGESVKAGQSASASECRLSLTRSCLGLRSLVPIAPTSFMISALKELLSGPSFCKYVAKVVCIRKRMISHTEQCVQSAYLDASILRSQTAWDLDDCSAAVQRRLSTVVIAIGDLRQHLRNGNLERSFVPNMRAESSKVGK